MIWPGGVGRGRRCGGFTLVEMVAVVALIAVLVGILLPTVTALRRMAGRTAAINGLRQLGVGITQYTTDWRGFLPGPLAGGNSIHFYRGNQQIGAYVYEYFNEPPPKTGVDSGELHALRDRVRERAGFETEFIRTLRYFPAGGKSGPFVDPCGYPGAGTYPMRLNAIARPGSVIFLQDSALENYPGGTHIPATAFYGGYLTLYFDAHIEVIPEPFTRFVY